MDAALAREMRERSGNACEYCRMPHAFYATMPFPIDHIIARQHGGPTIPENLALSCLHDYQQQERRSRIRYGVTGTELGTGTSSPRALRPESSQILQPFPARDYQTMPEKLARDATIDSKLQTSFDIGYRRHQLPPWVAEPPRGSGAGFESALVAGASSRRTRCPARALCVCIISTPQSMAEFRRNLENYWHIEIFCTCSISCLTR
jgi:HNH endonuclease